MLQGNKKSTSVASVLCAICRKRIPVLNDLGYIVPACIEHREEYYWFERAQFSIEYKAKYGEGK